MADDKSKRIFEGILNYKITKDSEFLKILNADVDDEKFQYFDNTLYEFIPEERFLDIGAYTGDTFSTFNLLYKNGWEHYYGLEADNVIYEELSKNIACHDKVLEKCEIYNVAAWDEQTTLYFESNAGSSSMNQTKSDFKISVCADKVDNILADENVTFIKMDIEGAEFNALKGMKELIQKNKPILAVCVYHRRDDYYKLTDFIENTVHGEYRFYFRQYRFTPTETVCYAIPRDRRVQ
jgi:FkbM family methyltransferase